MIENNRLPVVKGHLLDDEDLIIRRYILDLMCKGETKLIADFVKNEGIVERLEDMIKEGLVHVNKDHIIITPSGRSFLRNICMAFDLKLQNSKNEKELFSQAI
ncbi:hypothetical protein [Sphingobacterium sp. IITKGP-BTPF85]|uniref:hypothetical protein n=1 Tax=Sphingobacterium sp. IITKGP-BTPF85 TaxID=1338009 RepID=UPI00038A54C7|nr:hypothetical protein [Sphingobacterium sp. IITKGP-BTPF85]KKX48444.1 hypothetical protein L950_0221100 [Sphingobacterium sp. IITKGP-BTPF85]